MLQNPDSMKASSKEMVNFLASLFDVQIDRFLSLGEKIETPPDSTVTGERMAGVMAPNNQPEFWADAPWRIEPDQSSVPVTFYIRDADIDSPGYAPWRLDLIRIDQLLPNGTWHKLKVCQPDDLPGMDAQGNAQRGFWYHSIQISLKDLQQAQWGTKIRLRVSFLGSAAPYEKVSTVDRHLEIFLAQHPLPQSRAANPGKIRTWFYGDTHYHSAYTNDLKEYGAPLPETRKAATEIGLDWMVVTDHSCDLDEVDPGAGGHTRWEREKSEISSPGLSDNSFRFVQGEELTLLGKENLPLHMLAIGGLQELIPGAFLPDESEEWVTQLCIQAVKNILRLGNGYPSNLVESLFGKIYSLEEVIARCPQGTLLFAAHPHSVAQIPPAKWTVEDLENPALTGHEFWNGRTRRSATWTDEPFARSGWTDPSKLSRQDQRRIQDLKKYAQLWDAHLQKGVDEWDLTKPLPGRRPVFIGGSDAHGDFNYHAGMAWDYTSGTSLDDNALGKVRTVLYLPEHKTEAIPEVDEILAALKKGSCVVSDGPLLEYTLSQGTSVARMGETLIYIGKQPLTLNISSHTSPEFGPVTGVDVVIYTRSKGAGKRVVIKVKPEQPVELKIAGEAGYLRLETQTTGAGNEQFCCFTNPIWFKEAPRK